MFKSQTLFIGLAIIFLSGLTGCKEKSLEIKKQKVGDIELAYYTKGSGEPLVMVMGFKGTMSMWDPGLIDELAKHYTLVLFDNRGAGMSTDTQDNQTTIHQMAKDTAEFIKGLGYEKVNLLGWSMGSSIGMQLALDHPDLLKTLILCAPNPGGKNYIASKEVATKLTSTATSNEELLGLLFPSNNPGREATVGFVKRFVLAYEMGSIPNDLEVSTQTVERQTAALIARTKDDKLYEDLAGLKVPTLVTSGLLDVIDPPENSRLVAERIPFAWIAYFRESGHGFPSQDYLQLSRLIHVFINTEGE